MKPSKAGVSLVIHRLPELAEALNLAVARAKAAGLLREENGGGR